ncbi:cysteine synthase A [Fodinicurvata halophila]|uniref:cysteine synthase n=1 Tax=Fodinicurvata halophila TaxID=1419723 RepID=A0ABV8UPM4_9PROT
MDSPTSPKRGSPPSASPPPSRGRIFESVLDTVGATPLIRLSRLAEARRCPADILGKCEFFNPLSSVKDRIGVAMIEALEASGKIGPDTTIIEPTSGNTGIALAFACAAKGYRLILTMPETSSTERRKMLKLLGARLELTDGSLGMRGALDRADALLEEIGDAVIPQQFDNPANPEIHMKTTADEIWTDSGGRVDILVSSVGTGGTLTGVGRVLRQHNPDLHIVAVEPEDSAVLSGGMPGPHRIEGIGAGFVPRNLDTSLIDEVLKIGNDTAFRTARETAAVEGLPVGISSGAALAAALEVGERRENSGKSMVVILPSMAERYLSTQLFEGL